MAFERGPFALLGVVFGALVAIGGCGVRSVSSGGETHFLRYCSDDTICGDFDCLGRVCSWPCSEDRHCAELPGSRCVLDEVEPASELEASGRCEVRCAGDEDCSLVSPSHRCDQGACRLGALEPTDTSEDRGGSEPTTSGPQGDSAGECAAGRISGDARIVLGDSFFVTSLPVSTALDDSGRYRDYSSLDFNALALGGRGIEEQYSRAGADGPVETIVMTGGGADVLAGTCDPVDSTCPIVVDAVNAARSLFERFAGDGIARVFYVGYPEPQIPAVKERMDVLRPLLQELCATSIVPCSFVDLRPVFEGHYESYVLADGLNPSLAGVRATAAAVEAALLEACWEP